VVLLFLGVELICCDTLLELEILLDMYKSFFHALLDPELQDRCVALCSFHLDILASWFDSELPWSFEARFFFETIV